jgi:hypothetical protein
MYARCALQIKIPELFQIRAHDLIGIDVNDLVDVEREEDVEEQNLVAPNNALLLRLPSQPLGPLVRNELNFESKLLCHLKHCSLKVR